MIAFWSYLNPYFSHPQQVLQDAWKPLVIPVWGLSQHFMACSRQQEARPSPMAVNAAEKAGAAPEVMGACP